MKQIIIQVPDDLPPISMADFSPMENYVILKIGSECLREGRKAVAGLTQQELYEKIKGEKEMEIEKLEANILFERNLAKKGEEQLKDIYERQIEKMSKQMSEIKDQLRVHEAEKEEKVSQEIQKAIDKARENYDLLLREKDRQNDLTREAFDKAMQIMNKSKNKSSKEIGDDGEMEFGQMLETFKDFGGFRAENKSKQGHKGDFHLFFNEFNVLVDVKNYTDSVQKKEIEKIEADLSTNGNMNFAWLISLNSDIHCWNRFSIMNKWIMTDSGMKCIIFVNHLLESKDAVETLRMVWGICNEFNKLIRTVDKEDGELKKYREQNLICMKQIRSLQERSVEIRRSVNMSLSILKNMDSDLIEMLSLYSNEVMKGESGKNAKIGEWFESFVEFTGNKTDVLLSTRLWTQFRGENTGYVQENKITVGIFKETIMKIVGSGNYVERTKNGAVELIGYKEMGKFLSNEEKKEDILETENVVKNQNNAKLVKKTK
jgi:hypothetical protein